MDKQFWRDGLNFSCTRCSACCRHDPGFVFLSIDDLYRLLRFTQRDFRSFIDEYTKPVDIGTGYMLTLKEKPNNDCILWVEAGCVAYGARPLQCSTYPFWETIMEDGARWTEESADCPGIGKGPLVPPEAIAESIVAARRNPPAVISYDEPWERLHEDSILGGTRFSSYAPDAGKAQE